MSKNTPKDRPQQPRQTLSDAKLVYVLDLISRAGGVPLDRLVLQARGTCTRMDVSKAVDALLLAGVVSCQVRPWGLSIEPTSKMIVVPSPGSRREGR